MMNHEQGAVGSGHCARNHNRVVLGKYLDHFEIENGRSRVAHLTRHPHPLAHAPGIRTVTNRSAMAEIFVGSVRAGESREMMPLDNPGVAMPFRDSGYIDLVADLEYI